MKLKIQELGIAVFRMLEKKLGAHGKKFFFVGRLLLLMLT